MRQPAALSCAAALLLLRLSLAAAIDAVSRLSAAVASSTPSALPFTVTVRMVSIDGISVFPEVGQISPVHGPDQRREVLEIIDDQAVALGVEMDRAPRNRAT